MIAYVSIPYLGMDPDGNSTRNWAHMQFKSEDGSKIDRRRIKREVRKWVKRSLERTLHTTELRMLMKRVRYE